VPDNGFQECATFGRFPSFGKTLAEIAAYIAAATISRRGMAPISCRNILLTINVLHFLCIARDTPAGRGA